MTRLTANRLTIMVAQPASTLTRNQPSVVDVAVHLFSVGLSMDHEVFLLSRVKEAYDRSGDDTDASPSKGTPPAPSSPRPLR